MGQKINTKFASLATAILLIVSFPHALKADENPNSKSFQLGLTFSPNINWTKQSQGPMSPNGSKFGYSWGFMADFNLNKNKQNYFLNFEFLSTRVFNKIRIKEDGTVFTRKNNTSSFDQVDLTYNINYIEVPISLKLKFNEIGYVTWFAQIGITPSILYSSKAKWTGIVANSSDEVSVEYYKNNSGEFDDNEFHNFSDDSKYYRFGTFLGAGMEYRFSGNTALLASIRYNNGLSNFLNDKEDPRVKATNKFIALHVGLLF